MSYDGGHHKEVSVSIPYKIKLYDHWKIDDATTRATCDYENNRTLRVFIRPVETDGGDKIFFDQTLDPSIFSIN